MTKPATLYLIVGPSGAGKDALINAARARLGAEFDFPRRYITRDAGDESENHIPVSQAEFDRHKRSGKFALSWQAHDTHYAVPRTIEATLGQHRHVVINVSRQIIDEARDRFKQVRVILVTAPPEVLADRLRTRGREAEAGRQSRLARQVEIEPDTTIVNDQDLERAEIDFIAALES